jgi:uncharacterized protein (UPF0332 family)
MNPRAFLNVADDLLDGNDEEQWRSAVSRAYYAAFHVARQLLVRCGFVVPRAERAHAYVTMRLANSGHPDIGDAGDRLEMLRRARNIADYDLDSAYPFARAHDDVSSAREIIRLLDEVRNHDPARDRITQAMRDYERDVLKEVTWQPPSSPSAS